MKNILLLYLAFLFAACSSEKNQETISETEDLLSVSKLYKDNIFDVLYNDLKEHRPELKKLDEQVKEADLAKENALKEYQKYNTKNEQFYFIANQQLALIKDSLLRNSVEVLLNKSQYAYEQDNAAMALSIAQIENKRTSLHDRQKALKIILTTQLIEKYQKKHVPDHSVHPQILDRYNTALKLADSLLHAK